MSFKRFAPIFFFVLCALVGLYGSTQASETTTVNIISSVFTPNDVTINVGDTVTWNNQGGFHSVASTSAESFGNSASSSAWSYSHTFNTAGDFTYVCGIHSFMTGVVHVTEAAPTAITIKSSTPQTNTPLLLLLALGVLAFATHRVRQD